MTTTYPIFAVEHGIHLDTQRGRAHHPAPGERP